MKQLTVGIFAQNEENNINKCLLSIKNQQLPGGWRLAKVIVVVSGSTDKTCQIIKQLQKRWEVLQLITEPIKRGKVSAVNTFLKNSSTSYLVYANADSIVEKKSFYYLLTQLQNPNVGLTCAQVVPLCNPDTFMGFAATLQWQLHHKINLAFPDRPKAGELLAFKRVFKRLHHRVPTDEANIEAIIKTQGYDVVYVPQAKVIILTPASPLEFITQRRRIYAQHLRVKSHQSYQVVTMSNFRLIGTYLSNISFEPKFLLWSFATMTLEAASRLLATIDVRVLNKSYHTWPTIVSTKRSITKLLQNQVS